VLSSPYFRPRLTDGWFWPRAPHVSPQNGQQNEQTVRRLDQLNFTPVNGHTQHQNALVHLREVYEQVLVPLSYLEEDDALGLCVVNCNLMTLLEREENTQCVIYLMDQGHRRVRRLTNGFIPQLFQGRSSAGAQSYPGDRFFCDRQLPTVQIHMLTVRDQNEIFDNVPAVAVKLPHQEDILVHDE
jgi:hypothetical protein